jgi:hypothetical protein
VADPQPHSDSPVDRLWREYAKAFREFDDLTLARWCAQTLGQLHGRAWRMSHPLVASYRLAAQVSHERGLWMQRLVNVPLGYTLAECCNSPLLPYLTRDSVDHGLCCIHCNETAIPLSSLPATMVTAIREWGERYAQFHEVAHWEEKRTRLPGYEKKFEEAAQHVEQLLAIAAEDLVPQILEQCPALIWEDQDECLEVRPEDVPT